MYIGDIRSFLLVRAPLPADTLASGQMRCFIQWKKEYQAVRWQEESEETGKEEQTGGLPEKGPIKGWEEGTERFQTPTRALQRLGYLPCSKGIPRIRLDLTSFPFPSAVPKRHSVRNEGSQSQLHFS
jgi:hypothetical protein